MLVNHLRIPDHHVSSCFSFNCGLVLLKSPTRSCFLNTCAQTKKTPKNLAPTFLPRLTSFTSRLTIQPRNSAAAPFPYDPSRKALTSSLSFPSWYSQLSVPPTQGTNNTLKKRRESVVSQTVAYKTSNNLVCFKFRHLANFSRFSTKISALKLPILSPKLHTRPLF